MSGRSHPTIRDTIVVGQSISYFRSLKNSGSSINASRPSSTHPGTHLGPDPFGLLGGEN